MWSRLGRTWLKTSSDLAAFVAYFHKGIRESVKFFWRATDSTYITDTWSFICRCSSSQILNLWQNCQKIGGQRKWQKEEGVLPFICILRNPLRIPLLTWTNTSWIFFVREIISSFRRVDIGGLRMLNVTPYWLCVKKHVLINSQELYTMQNYTSRQTQMTKLWHFSNLTAYFRGDLGKKRSKDTKHITALLRL